MSNETILKEHLEFKRLSVTFEPKLKDIERALKRFLDFPKKSFSDFNERDLISFFNSLSKTYSIRSINDIKTYVKVFVKWYFTDWSSRFRNLDKICRLQQPQRAYEPEDLINFQELEKLVNGEKDLMWKVYWLVLFYGGFRPGECCSLTWKNVYFERKGVILKIHTTKTNKDFYKALPGNVEHFLKEWKRFNNSDFLFPSPLIEGQPIRTRSVCGRLKRLSKRVLGREVVPYALRHSIATALYKNDSLKDDDVARQMGHNKSMKSVYMNLDNEDLKTKARNLWIKTQKLSSNEREELSDLRERVKLLEEVYSKSKKLLS